MLSRWIFWSFCRTAVLISAMLFAGFLSGRDFSYTDAIFEKDISDPPGGGGIGFSRVIEYVDNKERNYCIVDEWLGVVNAVIPVDITYSKVNARGRFGPWTHPVKHFSYGAFKDAIGLKSLMIPNTIEPNTSASGDGYAFSGCTGLESVTLGCNFIGEGWFKDCTSLRSIDLSSITSLGVYAFHGSGLEKVTLNPNLSSATRLSYRFAYCGNLSEVVLENGILSIGGYDFKGCTALRSIKIPSSVTYLGPGAFMGCTSLMDATILGCSTTTDHDGIFKDCTSLKSVTIGNGVTTLNKAMFQNCTSLENVTIGRMVTELPPYLFSYCTRLKSIVLNGNAPVCQSFAFEYVPSDCTVYVHRDSTGWGVDIPGTWKGLRIEYIESGSGGGSGGETPPVGESFDLGFYSGRTNYEDWRDSMFVTTTQGGTTPMTSIAQGAKIYLYYGFANLAGNFDMGGFVNRFTLSTGAAFEDNWSNSTLAAGQWGWGGKSYSPAALQNLAPGTYTLTCTLDATSKLSETNEGNNTKSITFTIVASDLDEGEYDPLVKIYCLVSFDPNGGDRVSIRVGGIESRYMLKGKTLGAYGDLPVPTRSGYTFVGWFTAADGGTRVTASTKVTGNVTYYAHWEKIGGDASSSGGGSATPVPSGGAGWTAKGARTLNGAMYDAAGNLAGVVQLKVARPNARKRTVKLSGYVVPLDGKKVALRADAAVAYTGAPLTVNATSRAFGAFTANIDDSGFSGKIGGYTIRTANVGGNWARTNAKVQVATTSFLTGTVEALLPNGEPVLAVGGRWAFNRAASVKLSKDKSRVEWDTSRGRTNLSGMKLTYTPKTGLFKGSFKVYVLEGVTVRKRLKKYTFNVTGVVVGGVGYGVATCKRPAASWTVTVE